VAFAARTKLLAHLAQLLALLGREPGPRCETEIDGRLYGSQLSGAEFLHGLVNRSAVGCLRG